MEESNTVELEQHNIFALIPKDSIALTITATLLDENGNPYQVHKKMSAGDIFEARKDFLDYVEDGDNYDTCYIITDQGREWLEQNGLNPSNSTGLERR